MTKYLLKAGAEVDIADKDGYTALLDAAYNGHTEIVAILLEAGANAGHYNNDKLNAIHYANLEGHKDIMLLLKGAVNTDISAESDKLKQTPLMFAVNQAKMEDVKLLVEELGADVNQADINGTVVLHTAAMTGELEMVKYLVENGADVNKKDATGQSAILSATLAKKIDIITYLVEKGVSVVEADAGGTTPFHYAAMTGDLDIVKFYVKHGATAMMETNEQNVPLDFAAMLGHAELVKWLVEELGADVDHVAKDGKTAFDYASTIKKDAATIEYLKNKSFFTAGMEL